ncbi:MAG: hypothetical protein KIS81_03195 [Maricaulaceae bacterium]|nr:hypothetical protein [Maricaulaceae bacterium]
MHLDPDTVSRLQAVLKGRADFSAGRLQVVPVDSVKARIGEAWKAKQERVLELIKSVMRRRLGPADVLIDLGQTGFFIIYGELEGEAAALKTAAIAEEAFAHVVGESAAAAAAMEIRSRTLSLSSASLADEGGIAAAFQRGETAGTETVAVGGAPPESDAPALDAGAGEKRRGGRLRPIWTVGKQAIFNYRVIAPEPPAAASQGDAGLRAMLCETATVAAARLISARQREMGTITLLTLPVSHETLTRAALRGRYFEALRAVGEADRRRMILEVSPSGGALGERIWDEIARGVRSAGFRIRAVAGEGETNLVKFRSMGFESVGLDLGAAAESLPRKARRLEAFAERAQVARVAIFVNGADTLSLATLAVCSGAADISGDAIQPDGDGQFAAPVRFFDQDAIRRLIA